MMKPFDYTLALLLFLLLPSCQMTENEKLEKLLREWNGKEIVFPESLSFTIYGETETDFRIPTNGYKIVHYVDSTGCVSCKLNLSKWMEYIAFIDSVTHSSIPCLFFIHAKQKREMKISMKQEHFDYPVCLDTENEFYKLNRFPMHPMLQTFLLDKDNRIVAMGDPITNPKITELYIALISGKRGKLELEQTRTKAGTSTSAIDFGTFHWEERKDTVVKLTNKGEKPLLIHDIATSCGCTVADYDKRPVQPGESISVRLSFKADYPGYFCKTVGIYCNAKQSPLKVQIKGYAEKRQNK